MRASRFFYSTSICYTVTTMAHIHPLIDWTVSAYILHPTEPKVLMVNHKLLNMWLPIGGHVELDEDPDEALMREIKEECGLEVEILAEKKPGEYEHTKMLYRPHSMDIHTISETHRHIGLQYVARALTTDIQLAPEEHDDIRWFTSAELDAPDLIIRPAVKMYAQTILAAHPLA